MCCILTLIHVPFASALRQRMNLAGSKFCKTAKIKPPRKKGGGAIIGGGKFTGSWGKGSGVERVWCVAREGASSTPDPHPPPRPYSTPSPSLLSVLRTGVLIDNGPRPVWLCWLLAGGGGGGGGWWWLWRWVVTASGCGGGCGAQRWLRSVGKHWLPWTHATTHTKWCTGT